MKTMSPKTKKILRIIYTLTDILLCALLVSGAAWAAYLYFGSKQGASLASDYEALEENIDGIRHLDKQNSIYFATDDEFSVLIISDLQLGAGRLTLERDRETLAALYKLITEEKPDLTVFIGGASYPSFSESGNADNLAGSRLLISFMNNLQTWWAVSPVPYESDFYNQCTQMTPWLLHARTCSFRYSNKTQLREFGGVTNISSMLCNMSYKMRMCMAVLDYTQTDGAAQEQWVSEWLESLQPQEAVPSEEAAREYFVVSPYELEVPDGVTLILPEKAAQGEYFSHREIIIDAVAQQEG